MFEFSKLTRSLYRKAVFEPTPFKSADLKTKKRAAHPLVAALLRAFAHFPRPAAGRLPSTTKTHDRLPVQTHQIARMPSIMSHNNENEVPHALNNSSRTAKVSRKVTTPPPLSLLA